MGILLGNNTLKVPTLNNLCPDQGNGAGSMWQYGRFDFAN